MKLSKFDPEARRREGAAKFPGSRFGIPPDVNRAVLSEFRAALIDGSEESIQKVLTSNPYLIQYAIDRSGHHGVWVFPKPMIKTRSVSGTAGLIPDYLVASRSSLGYFWHIVELKRFDVQFSRKDGLAFSTAGNEAIAQCNRYLSHFQDYVDAVRSNIQVDELIQPRGAIILIGDSEKESENQRQLRTDFVTNTPRIDVVSYQRIIAALESDLPPDQ